MVIIILTKKFLRFAQYLLEPIRNYRMDPNHDMKKYINVINRMFKSIEDRNYVIDEH